MNDLFEFSCGDIDDNFNLEQLRHAAKTAGIKTINGKSLEETSKEELCSVIPLHFLPRPPRKSFLHDNPLEDQPNEIIRMILSEYLDDSAQGDRVFEKITFRDINVTCRDIYDMYAPIENKLVDYDVHGMLNLPYKWLYKSKKFDVPDEVLPFIYKWGLYQTTETFLQEHVSELAEKLRKTVSLRELALQGRSLGGGYLRMVTPSLHRLKRIILYDTGINDEDIDDVAMNIPHLLDLDISQNTISSIKTIENIRINLVKLERLAIGGDSEIRIPEVFVNIGQILSLRKLDLSAAFQGEEEAADFLPHIGSLVNLEQLVIFGNDMGARGSATLAKILPRFTKLTELFLPLNEIGPQGAEYLVPALVNLTSLKSLNLSLNFIGTDGMKRLSKILPNLFQLTSLDLGDNSAQDIGIEALLPSLEYLSNLRFLGLNGNFIHESLSDLLEAASNMISLTTLNIYNNGISEDDPRLYFGPHIPHNLEIVI